MFASSTLSIIGVLILIAAYILYRAALPRPIPGIPYNKTSARRIFGDVPEFLAYQAETSGTLSQWIAQQATEFESPVFQLFLRPFGKPWVVTSDFREAQDVMVRRAREFDRR